MNTFEKLIDIVKKHPDSTRLKIDEDCYRYLRQNALIVYQDKKQFSLGLELVIDKDVIFAETE
jgi:hypothetical protein